MSNEASLAQAFVQLADSLTDDFNAVDHWAVLLDRVGGLLGARSGAIVLADDAGGLAVAAASTEEARGLATAQLQTVGPCVECVRTGSAVHGPDLAVAAFPLRLRSIVLGAVTVFFDEAQAISEPDDAIVQGMADVTTVAVLQHRAAREAAILVGQLQAALDSRVSIEQAKGVLAERAQITTDEAFARLRAFARARNTRLHDVALDVIHRRLDAESTSVLVTGEDGNVRHKRP